MKKKLILSLVCSISLILTSQVGNAQSWLITGNNNTTALSKLGTTNFIPLSLYTNNTERIRIDEIGRVGIGISAPVNVLTVKSTAGLPVASWTNGLTSPVFVGFADNASSESVLAAASNISVRRPVMQGRRARGTLAAPAAVQNNDYLSSFLASGFDGNTFQNPATIDFFVDGVPSAGNVPARISFVTGSNQANRTERLKVGSTGNFNFNGNQLTIQQSTGDVGIGIGDLNFSNGFQTIQFSNPGASNSPMINLFESGTTNNNRMVIAHSPAYPDWGLQYSDANDDFEFLSSGSSVLHVGLGSRRIGIGNTDPAFILDVAGRTRVRSGDGTAGIWFMNPDNSNNGSFFGTFSNDFAGLFGNAGAVWGLLMNVSTGNVGIGNSVNPGSYKTKISHGLFGLDIENASSADDWELYTTSGGLLQIYFNGNLRGAFNNTTGAYTATSDERLKTNIKPMTTMLEKISQLKPATYQFKNTTDKQEYLGFIAQDVMKVFPSMVTHNVNKERDLELYTMDYTGFGVIAVKGIQELQVALKDKDEEIATLNEEVATLKNELGNLKNLLISKGLVTNSELNNTAVSNLSKASLAQSVPNPSKGITTLSYYLPNEVKKASIVISAINGAVLKSYPISQMGNGQLTINSKDFATGTYIYTLVANGKKIASQKMIVAK